MPKPSHTPPMERVSGDNFKLFARFRRVRALVRKEFRQIVRDPSSILIAIVLPLILLFIFGYGVSLDAQSTRVGLVMENSTPIAEELVASFQGSSYFEITVGRDRREMEDSLVHGDLQGIIVIPAGFHLGRGDGAATKIQVILDGSDPNTAKYVTNFATSTISNSLQIINPHAPSTAFIQVEPRFWFNSELASRNFLVPGSIVIVMTLVGTLLTSLVLAREWERGTMEAMIATPVSAMEILLGKFIPYFALGLLSMSLCFFLAVTLFDVPFRGSILALYAMSMVFLLPALGQGLLISAITKNQFLASQIALFSGFLPAFLLSGFLFEIDSMPRPIQFLTTLVPARYLIPSIQSIFLVGDIWPMFLQAMAILAFVGILLLSLAFLNTKKRMG